MDFINIIKTRRSIRKFKQDELPIQDLKELIDCARLAPSAANVQPLEYAIITNKDKKEEIFQTTRWAGYIQNGTPQEQEKPTAFIAIIIDNEKVSQWGAVRDIGASAENIMLAAHAKNIGTCWIASADMEKVKTVLNLEEKYTVDSLIALGYPAEESCIENDDEKVKYWKDESDKMHVPKRKLESILKIVE
jgi:nitroreductase